VVWTARFYLVSILGLWALLATEADHWWFPTLILYGPRWFWLAPLSILVPAAVVFSPRTARILLCAGLVVVGPVQGFRPPWPRWPAGRDLIKVMTCNVQGDHADLAALLATASESEIDIICFQEWGMSGTGALGTDPRHVRVHRSFCLASRFPILELEALSSLDQPWRDLALHAELDVPGGSLHLFNLHLSTPRPGLEAIRFGRCAGIPALVENIGQRSVESELVCQWVDRFEGPALIAGDFNMPVDSAIFRRDWSRYADAFSAAGFGFGHTKFTRWEGIRIDHVLAAPGLRFYSCRVGPDVGSDHRPVIAEVELTDGRGL
jgi:endonuclease/exonuclease/phosphatase (EEP) superfamily protein YafD